VAAVVVISTALGIAANTTVFSIINGLLLGSLPVREPDRLVTFSSGNYFSYPDYIAYRDQTQDVFEGVTWSVSASMHRTSRAREAATPS
jgi:hypothetical protein